MNYKNKAFSKKILPTLLYLFLSISFSSISFAQIVFDDPYTISDFETSIREPRALVPFDFDGDGDLDVVATSKENDQIVWLENIDGLGNFSNQNIITSGVLNPGVLRFGDINGDGLQDIISGTGYLVWLVNLGNGNFGAPEGVVSGSSVEIHPADIDGDGDLDVVRASGNKIYWQENQDGAGDFPASSIQITPSASEVKAIDVVDIDGDGDEDVISASSGNDRIAWYENQGDGTFGDQIILENALDFPSFVRAGDVDGDGDFDIVASFQHSNTIGWFKNINGLGNFTELIIISEDIESPITVEIADLDGDGDMDVAASKQYNEQSLRWYTNEDGQGNFNAGQLIAESYSGFSILTTADFDNNGLIDVLGAHTQSSSVMLYKSSPTPGIFETGSIVSTPIRNPGIQHTADINGDGFTDYIASSRFTDQVFWYPNDGSGQYLAPRVIAPYIPELASCFPFDVDSDGDMDFLASGEENNEFYIYWVEHLDGIGNFGPRQILANTNLKAYEFFGVDLDGDGDQDLVSSDYITNEDELSWYENIDNSSSFGPQQNISTANVSRITAMDYDNDGDQDLLFYSGNAFRWLTNEDGQGTFAGFPQTAVPLEFLRASRWADFDKDGDTDLIVYRNDLSQIEWYEKIDGQAEFSAPEIIGAVETEYITEDNYIRYIQVIDIDQDSDNDVVVSGDYEGISDHYLYLCYYLNLSDGSEFSEKIEITTNTLGVSSEQIAVADVDNDNDDDIIWGFSKSNISGVVTQFKNLNYSPRISGSFFLDENENKIQDNDEPRLSNQGVELLPSGTLNFSNQNGDFFFTSNPGNYTLQNQIEDIWELTTDSSSYSITSNGSSIDGFDFGLKPAQLIQSLAISSATQITRCNTDAPFWINYTNTGTETISGKVQLVYDELTEFNNVVPMYNSVSGDTLVWEFTDLPPTQTNRIKVSFGMPTASSIGAPIDFISTVYGLQENGDYQIFDEDLVESILVCAYDPNDKLVKPAGLDEAHYILKTDTLEYTIRFQNTGNDTAFLVNIIDQLHNRLDLSTFEPVGASHDYSVSMNEGGQLTFRFEDILLPDSTTNFEGSQGFVSYKIKPKTNLNQGNRIENFAAIYFDLNPPITTNTTENTIYICDGIMDVSLQSLDICQQETLIGNADDLISSTVFNWSIDGIFSDTGKVLNWNPDTTGTFILQVASTNELCQEDATFEINILAQAEILMVDSFEICSGENILIFDELQNTAGIYFDSIQTQAGCDSIIGIRLEVNQLAEISLLFDEDTICSNLAFVHLPEISPEGGILTGPGIMDSLIITDDLGAGTFWYNYTFTDSLGCESIASQSLTIVTCTEINEFEDHQIKVYPNPFEHTISIEVGELPNETSHLFIYSNTGVRLHQVQLSQNTTRQVPLHRLAAGHYFYELVSRDQRTLYRGKLIKLPE